MINLINTQQLMFSEQSFNTLMFLEMFMHIYIPKRSNFCDTLGGRSPRWPVKTEYSNAKSTVRGKASLEKKRLRD